MPVYLDLTVTQNFAEAIGREWLETNGIGGWASSTIGNVHTRRYHGLLVAATRQVFSTTYTNVKLILREP